jgi:hypothetical protein
LPYRLDRVPPDIIAVKRNETRTGSRSARWRRVRGAGVRVACRLQQRQQQRWGARDRDRDGNGNGAADGYRAATDAPGDGDTHAAAGADEHGRATDRNAHHAGPHGDGHGGPADSDEYRARADGDADTAHRSHRYGIRDRRWNGYVRPDARHRRGGKTAVRAFARRWLRRLRRGASRAERPAGRNHA